MPSRCTTTPRTRRPRRWCPRSARVGGRAVALAADLADEAAVKTLLPSATAALGPIGVLVNNASIFENDTVATATRESWDAHLAVNLRAPFVLIQEFAARLPKDAGGVVVNLLDQRVWNLTPYFVSYTLEQVRAVDPDPNDGAGLGAAHPGQRHRARPDPAEPAPEPRQFARQCRMMPLSRGTSPDEIAAALRFILAAPAMTGQMIALDGGQHLGWAQPRTDRPGRIARWEGNRTARQNAPIKLRKYLESCRRSGVVHSGCGRSATPSSEALRALLPIVYT